MRSGDNAMPSYAIGWDGAAFRPTSDPISWNRSNDDFWGHVDRAGADVIAIDGPCAVHPNGPRWIAGRSVWEAGGTGVRAAERELTAGGIHLFWTTRNTVLHFDGASRWIARSLTLFAESRLRSRPAETIETHPHGAFVFLWRLLGGEGPPPRKASPAGRLVRWAILRAFIEQLPETPPASHDEIDALCAALVAGLHRLKLTVAFGTPAEGGEIWMPDVRQLSLLDFEGRLAVVDG